MPLLDVDRDAPDTGYNRKERRAIKLSGLLMAAVAVVQVRACACVCASCLQFGFLPNFSRLMGDYERYCWPGLYRWSLGFVCFSI